MSQTNDYVELSDITRQFLEASKTRQEVLLQLQHALLELAQGHKLKAHEQIKLIEHCTKYLQSLDQSMISLVTTLSHAINAIAKNNANLLELYARVRAVLLALEKKQLVTEAELDKIYHADVVDELLHQAGLSREQFETLLAGEPRPESVGSMDEPT